jgi:hypothetical protein
MTPVTFYRIAVWLPIVLPSLFVIDIHVIGSRWSERAFGPFVQWPLMMFVFGGPTYAPLALWATFWLRGKTRSEIHRMAIRAPWLMVPMFLALSIYLLVRSRDLAMPAAFFVMGSVLSVVLGYSIVIATFGLERLLELVGVVRVDAVSSVTSRWS